MKRKKINKPSKKEEANSLVITGNETANELYSRYIATQNQKIRKAWIEKYKEEKENK